MKRIFLAITAILLLAVVSFSITFSIGLAETATTTKKAYSAFSTTAQSMVLIDGDDGSLLAEFNSEKKLPMASTTKIATAITVIEKEQDLNRIVEVPLDAQLTEGSSIYLKAGDRLRIIDLLYGLMLRSGNDCAVTLATAVSGSIEGFSKEMNALAKKIGAQNTNFVNPHGLHHDNHYTTALDLAKISAYAMKNKDFLNIVSSKKYTFKMQNAEHNQVLLNKNKILSTLDGGDGIKTGFTKKAGRCLVSSATRSGKRLICVVFNCGPMFEDCARLIDEGFKLYNTFKIVDKDKFVATFKAVNCDRPTIMGTVKNGYEIMSKNKQIDDIKISRNLDKNLAFPVKKGDKIGNIKIYSSKQLLFEEKLYSIEDVSQLSPEKAFTELTEKWDS